jgi:hypothetical protein
MNSVNVTDLRPVPLNPKSRNPKSEIPLPCSDYQRTAKRKVQPRLRWNFQLLAFCQNLNGSRAAPSNTGTNSGAFAASSNRTDDRSDRSAAGCTLGSLSAAAFSDFGIL